MDRRIQADKAFLKWSEKTSKNVVHIADAWYAAVKWADKTLLNNVCKWLEERQAVDLVVPNIEKFINDFKKDMEEQQ